MQGGLSGSAYTDMFPEIISSLILQDSQVVKNPPAIQETLVGFLGWKDTLEKEQATYSSILVWKIPMDRGAWWASPWGHKSDMTE